MSKKAQVLAHNLASELKIRSTLAIVEGYDTNGDPTITVGDGVAGHRNAVIRVKSISWPLAQDALGLADSVYAVNVMQVCTEANPTSGAGADILLNQDQLDLMLCIGRRGTTVEWYVSTNGTAPATAQMTSGNLQASYVPELKWDILASQ